jgi:hypothetical protein
LPTPALAFQHDQLRLARIGRGRETAIDERQLLLAVHEQLNLRVRRLDRETEPSRS